MRQAQVNFGLRSRRTLGLRVRLRNPPRSPRSIPLESQLATAREALERIESLCENLKYARSLPVSDSLHVQGLMGGVTHANEIATTALAKMEAQR